MISPEGNLPKPSLAQVQQSLEIINLKIEAADENENVIERSRTLDTLGEERDWLITEIAAFLHQNDK